MQMINWRRGCNNTGSRSRVRSRHSECFIVVLNTQIIRCVFVWSTVAVERLLNELASLLKMLDHEAVSPATADKMASVRNIVDSMQLSGTTGFIFSLFFLFCFWSGLTCREDSPAKRSNVITFVTLKHSHSEHWTRTETKRYIFKTDQMMKVLWIKI